MKLLCLTRYADLGASSRMRLYQYIPSFNDSGIYCSIAPFFNNSYIYNLYNNNHNRSISLILSYARRLVSLFKSKTFDLVWIEKELFPFLPAIFENILSKFNIPYIVDYDDAIFHNYDRNTSSVIRTMLKNKIARVMKYSKLVIVGNEYLADYAIGVGASKVEIIPTVINLKNYPIVQSNKNKSDLITVGWIGSPATTKYLVSYLDLFNYICKNHNIQFRLIGAKFEQSLPNDFKIVPWTEDSEVQEIEKLDIGIMPLANGPWERGKCGYKLIQYMGCFLPVVASPIGANCKIVDHQQNGFLAQSQDEWRDYLIKLITNRQLRNEMGEKGRAKIEKRYCLDVTAPQIVSLLNSLQ